VAGVEVDICEHRVVDRVGKNIAGGVHQALHWDVRGKDHKSKTFVTDDLGLADGFHTYGVEWTKTEYRFFIDGKLTWTAEPVSKRPEFVLFSSEVRDKSWAGNVPPGGYGSRETSKTRMVVDYVRFYEKGE
jgi:beta-glucanase (GH16 family)